MSKYLIEVNDDAVDDRAGELIQRMVDEGGIQLVSPSLDLDVKILGTVTAEDCPGDQHIVAIELFD